MNDHTFKDPSCEDKPLKIVVFDLDETLGYFTQFGMFWDSLQHFLKRKLDQQDFNRILDLYPEFIRPNIVQVLKFLKVKKKFNKCNHLMIYTNNQGPKEWAIFIKNYFEYKLGTPIFDRIIAAFKVNGKQVEFCRTTHSKTHGDFIKCTKVPKNSQICFLDDVYHPSMKNDNVYYINVKPYVHDLPLDTLTDRFVTEFEGTYNLNGSSFKEIVETHFRKFNHHYIEKEEDEYEIDKILTKEILRLIQAFFNKKMGHTRKVRKYNNVTLKHRTNV
jgi:hypothetical protein